MQNFTLIQNLISIFMIYVFLHFLLTSIYHVVGYTG